MRLRHENVVPLLGFTTDFPFSSDGPSPIALVMPWMSRGSLETALAVDLPDADRLDLLQGVAEGLVYREY